GKQRSVHNTYFTLPVVFAMLSTHYAAAWSHPHSGWVLALFMAAAAMIRQFFVLWHSGQRAWWLPALGTALLVATFAWLAPRPPREEVIWIDDQFDRSPPAVTTADTAPAADLIADDTTV